MKRMLLWLIAHGLVLVIMLVFLLAFVPVFSDMYKDFGAPLPFFTRILVNLSSFLRRYMFFFMSPALLLFFGLDGWVGWRLLHRGRGKAAAIWWGAILAALCLLLALMAGSLFLPIFRMNEVIAP